MVKYIPLVILFILGLVYLTAPGPNSIHDFPAIPYATKSQLEGDTIQNPNNKAYYSDWSREEATTFYREFFEKANFFYGIPLPAIRLNHPPEDAFVYIRDQQESTYLEEYVYPLRGSIFVNGYEPKVARTIPARAKYVQYDFIEYDGRTYLSKTTLRYYPSPMTWRIVVYIGIWIAIIIFYLLIRQGIKRK